MDDKTKIGIDVASFFLFMGIAAYSRGARRPEILAAAVWIWILILILTA